MDEERKKKEKSHRQSYRDRHWQMNGKKSNGRAWNEGHRGWGRRERGGGGWEYEGGWKEANMVVFFILNLVIVLSWGGWDVGGMVK